MYNEDIIDKCKSLLIDLKLVDMEEEFFVNLFQNLKSIKAESKEFKNNDFNSSIENEILSKGAMSLVYLKQILESAIEHKSSYIKDFKDYKVFVKLESDFIFPTYGFLAYRGNYNCLTLDYRTQVGYVITEKANIMLSDSFTIDLTLKEILDLLDGSRREGYKGGYYRYGDTTPIFASKSEDDASNLILVGYEINDDIKALIFKAKLLKD